MSLLRRPRGPTAIFTLPELATEAALTARRSRYAERAVRLSAILLGALRPMLPTIAPACRGALLGAIRALRRSRAVRSGDLRRLAAAELPARLRRRLVRLHAFACHADALGRRIETAQRAVDLALADLAAFSGMLRDMAATTPGLVSDMAGVLDRRRSGWTARDRRAVRRLWPQAWRYAGRATPLGDLAETVLYDPRRPDDGGFDARIVGVRAELTAELRLAAGLPDGSGPLSSGERDAVWTAAIADPALLPLVLRHEAAAASAVRLLRGEAPDRNACRDIYVDRFASLHERRSDPAPGVLRDCATLFSRFEAPCELQPQRDLFAAMRALAGGRSSISLGEVLDRAAAQLRALGRPLDLAGTPVLLAEALGVGGRGPEDAAGIELGATHDGPLRIDLPDATVAQEAAEPMRAAMRLQLCGAGAIVRFFGADKMCLAARYLNADRPETVRARDALRLWLMRWPDTADISTTLSSQVDLHPLVAPVLLGDGPAPTLRDCIVDLDGGVARLRDPESGRILNPVHFGVTAPHRLPVALRLVLAFRSRRASYGEWLIAQVNAALIASMSGARQGGLREVRVGAHVVLSPRAFFSVAASDFAAAVTAGDRTSAERILRGHGIEPGPLRVAVAGRVEPLVVDWRVEEGRRLLARSVESAMLIEPLAPHESGVPLEDCLADHYIELRAGDREAPSSTTAH